jgi:hypothetical protein
MKQSHDDEVDAMVKDALAKARVEKGMEGDESASKEFDIGETVQDANNQPTNGSLRLGDSRMLPNKTAYPNGSRTYQTTGDAQVLAADPFLHGDQGEANANGGPAGGARLPVVRPYAIDDNVDGDKRGSENFMSPGESGIAPAAAPNFPSAGEVGSRVIAKRAGLFTDVIMGRAK